MRILARDQDYLMSAVVYLSRSRKLPDTVTVVMDYERAVTQKTSDIFTTP